MTRVRRRHIVRNVHEKQVGDRLGRRGLRMARLAAGQVRKSFADTLNRVAYGKERLVLHRRGKNVAAMVPVEDLALLEELETRLDLEEVRAALAETRKKGTISWEKLKAELGL